VQQRISSYPILPVWLWS